MKFIDEVTIKIKAGDGGDGCVSFRREKYVPRGGPDGGDGGSGVSVIIKADAGKSTLMDFRYQAIYKAKDGKKGMGSQMYGRGGEDLILSVPPGTVVYDASTDEILVDLVSAKDELIVAKGGKGGYGNLRFVSPTNRAPRRADPGGEGEEKELRLELKLLADVGLVGRPNAGKSTLLANVTAAKPKIADYPFTTLVPQLGVVRLSGGDGYTMADIPGLIEGAHLGVGMGIEFLKHIERTRVFLHLIDLSDPEHSDPIKSFTAIRDELLQYNPEFKNRPCLVVFSKMDVVENIIGAKEVAAAKKKFERKKFKVHCISSATGAGLSELKYAVQDLLKNSN